MRLSQKQNLSLVLSGGGAKAAAFHIGVCLALKEKGFQFAGGTRPEVSKKFPQNDMTFKTYVGSSAGAVVSAFLANGITLDEMIEAFTRGAGLKSIVSLPRKQSRKRLPRPISYTDIFALNFKAGDPATFVTNLVKGRSLLSTGVEALVKTGFHLNGIFSMRNVESYLAKYVTRDNNFASLGVRLFIVATQLNHSRKVVFGHFDEPHKAKHIQYANFAKMSQAVAASLSLPPFFCPYPIQNEKGKDIYYFDGEIRDTLSTHVAADHGSDLVIASYSIQPYHFNKEIGSLHKYGIPVIFNQALYQVVQQKISKHIEHQKEVKNLINAVHGYLKEARIPKVHRDKLMDILITRTKFRPNVDYIYIHPDPEDYEFFFADHFSLNNKVLTKIVRTGFKQAMATLRNYNI